MKIIELTQNKYTLVDDENFDFLMQWKWQYRHGYATRNQKIGNYYKNIFMHRVINKTPEDMETDHVNRNRLDNRKNNLRTVTKRQNQHNRGLSSNNKSGINGISWDACARKWKAQIRIDDKQTHLGLFIDLEEAASVRKLAEKQYYG